MALLIDHQPINVPAGSHSFETARTAGVIGNLRISIARCTTATPTFWPNASTVLDLNLYVSSNGGTTWRHVGGIGAAPGGVMQADDGSGDYPETFFGCRIASTVNRLRVTVSVTERLISQLTVEVT